jgi:hypothetical protein
VRSHPSRRARRGAATRTGRHLTAALHVACKLPDPPPDVVSMLLSCAPEVAGWQDSQGWLPLHHACANGASGRVLGLLVKAYPGGKICQDKRYRTPLHFAFFRREDDAQQQQRAGEGGGAAAARTKAAAEATTTTSTTTTSTTTTTISSGTPCPRS